MLLWRLRAGAAAWPSRCPDRPDGSTSHATAAQAPRARLRRVSPGADHDEPVLEDGSADDRQLMLADTPARRRRPRAGSRSARPARRRPPPRSRSPPPRRTGGGTPPSAARPRTRRRWTWRRYAVARARLARHGRRMRLAPSTTIWDACQAAACAGRQHHAGLAPGDQLIAKILAKRGDRLRHGGLADTSATAAARTDPRRATSTNAFSCVSVIAHSRLSPAHRESPPHLRTLRRTASAGYTHRTGDAPAGRRDCRFPRKSSTKRPRACRTPSRCWPGTRQGPGSWLAATA